MVYWILYWKWKAEWLSEYGMVVYPCDYVADWELCLPLPSTTREAAYS